MDLSSGPAFLGSVMLYLQPILGKDQVAGTGQNCTDYSWGKNSPPGMDSSLSGVNTKAAKHKMRTPGAVVVFSCLICACVAQCSKWESPLALLQKIPVYNLLFRYINMRNLRVLSSFQMKKLRQLVFRFLLKVNWYSKYSRSQFFALSRWSFLAYWRTTSSIFYHLCDVFLSSILNKLCIALCAVFEKHKQWGRCYWQNQ